MRFVRPMVAALVSSFFVVACGETPSTGKPSPSASVGKDPAMGGKLDEAANALDAKSSSSAVSMNDANQPPPQGIFAKGLADKAHAPGAAPKLELVGDGTEPRVKLHAANVEASQTMTLQIGVKIGQDQTPPREIIKPLEVKLHIGPPGSAPPVVMPTITEDKPSKSGKPAKPKPTAAPAAATAVASASASAGPSVAAPTAPVDVARPLVATILSATFAGDAEIPKALQEIILPLAGATLDFTMTPTGPAKFSHKLNGSPVGEAKAVVEIQLGAVEDALSVWFTPAPAKPVGKGAYWVVTDRKFSLGVDVVRYRLFRILEIQPDGVILAIEQQRQYAASPANELLGMLGLDGVVMAAYGVDAKGFTKVTPNAMWPVDAFVQQRVGSPILPEGAEPNPNIMHDINFEVVATMGNPQSLVQAAQANAPKPGPPQ